MDGVAVRLGDYIALLDDNLVLTANSAELALQQAIEMAGIDPVPF